MSYNCKSVTSSGNSLMFADIWRLEEIMLSYLKETTKTYDKMQLSLTTLCGN